MSTPTPTIPDFSAITDAPPDANFGPDHTKPNGEGPKLGGRAGAAKAAKEEKADPLGKLGKGAKARPGLRRLNADDKEKLAAYQIYAGMAIYPFREETGRALGETAEQCADAWFEMAEKNDSVRRAILAVVEGGAAGKLFMAYTPVLATLLPKKIPPWMKRFNLDRLFNREEPVEEEVPQQANGFVPSWMPQQP